jgi:hypothetical protein
MRIPVVVISASRHSVDKSCKRLLDPQLFSECVKIGQFQAWILILNMVTRRTIQENRQVPFILRAMRDVIQQKDEQYQRAEGRTS